MRVFWIAMLLLAGLGGNARACEAAADGACTAQGALAGVREGGLLAFKGIPYAAPPVGALRWRPPVAPVAWEGVRRADGFGPMCPQIIGGAVVGAEDCLTLNVWSPAEKPAAPLPVMVFLTGGGNHTLSGQGSASFGGVVYDGSALVPQGVVFVSVNIRLGALGFLAHPAFDAESPERVSGNWGSRDHIAMLGWLRENIAAFGGDPGRVMLFGTSAGGGNICALLVSPAAKGLFHAASMQSPVPTGCALPTLAQVEAGSGVAVTRALGCEGVADIAACLRGKTTEEVVKAVPGTFSVLPRLFGPNQDGVLFPEQPIEVIRAGRHNAMPILIGTTTDETLGWADTAGRVTDAASFATAVTRVFGEGPREAIAARYPLDRFESPRRAFAQVTTDAFFTCSAARVAAALGAAQPQPVHRYLFAHRLENDAALRAAGAGHTVEHPFLFGWGGSYRPTEQDLAIQRRMLPAWVGLIRGEAPKEPFWLFGEQPVADAQCGFWDGVPLPRPHL